MWFIGNFFLSSCKDYVDVNIVSLMAFWYANQQLCVRWMSTFSRFFTTTNGTRQGSILWPYLFSRYIRELLYEVVQSKCGCCIGDMMLNVLAYADDIVLLAPSWTAIQDLLHLLSKLSTNVDMTCTKRLCAWFSSRNSTQKLWLSIFYFWDWGANAFSSLPVRKFF